MVQAPTGTVTFLFTDIEGSTRLWDRYPVAMSEAQAVHDRLLRSAIDDCGGYVFSSAGDGVGASFGSPVQAIDTALRVQQALAAQAWPEPIPAIRVRMGLHTGTSVERGGDYFGTAVNRAARVSAAGNGGQILVTDTVHLLIADDAPKKWGFSDLGEHRLRDLVRAERLWQVTSPDLPAVSGELRVHREVGNLPPVRTQVLGRDEDVATISGLMNRHQLVTLTGVGGVGKTTLARTVGRDRDGAHQGGVWFVDLAPLDDPLLIAAAVASALGVTQRPEMTIEESLYDALRLDGRLVILDNAEHQVDAVAVLTDRMLTAAPDCALLVTSRESLAIEGEAIFSVRPLAVDDAGSPATELFFDRAARLAPDIGRTGDTEAVVARICRRLDGLPLAIELAAAQCETLTPAEILEGLGTHELQLRSGSRSKTSRHRSLEDTIRWSYDLLTMDEQLVFARLAAFSGGCTVEAAKAVCADETMTSATVGEAIRTLVRKSMVIVDRSGGATRLRLLETLREFAAAQLEDMSDHHEVATRHAAWFAQLSRVSAPGFFGPEEARYLSAVSADLDNLRVALRWAGEQRRFDLMADLGMSMPYLIGSKMRPEMLEWVKAALELFPADHPGRIAMALTVGHATLFGGDLEAAPRVFAEATTGLGDLPQVRILHRYLGLVAAFFAGALDEVIADSPQVIADGRAHDHAREAIATHVDLALALLFSGDLEAARSEAADVMREATEAGNPTLLAWAHYAAGEIAAHSDPEAAISLLEDAVEYGLSVDNEFAVAISLIALASTAGRNGQIEVALDGMHRCIGLWRAAGNRPQMWTAVRNLVELLHELGMDEDAYALHSVVEHDAEHAPELFGPYGERYLEIIGEVEASLGPAATTSAGAHGRSLRYSEAADYALGSIERARAQYEAEPTGSDAR